MRTRIKALLLSICMIFAFLLPSCKGMNNEQVQNPKDSNRIKIGMSFDSFIIERWQRDRDVFVSAAKELGAEVNVQNANGSLDEQNHRNTYLLVVSVAIILTPTIMEYIMKKIILNNFPL